MTNEIDNKTIFTDSVIERHVNEAEKRCDARAQELRDRGYRHDAIAFTLSQLEILEKQQYEVLYGNPQDGLSFLPVKTVHVAGETYTYDMLSKAGEAIIVADGAQDRNLVDADITQTSRKIYEIGTGYSYTIGDQERGSILNFDYVQTKARIAAERIASAHSEYALLGGSGVKGGNTSITGFLNDGNVNLATMTDADWTAVTGAAAYDAITDMMHEVVTQSSGLHFPTDVILSTFCWNVVTKELLNSAAGSQTVMSALRQNYPGVTFHRSASCTARGAAGVDRNVAYERKAGYSEYVVADMYTEATPDKQGFSYTVQTRGRMAGAIIRYPLSMIYGDITIA